MKTESSPRADVFVVRRESDGKVSERFPMGSIDLGRGGPITRTRGKDVIKRTLDFSAAKNFVRHTTLFDSRNDPDPSSIFNATTGLATVNSNLGLTNTITLNTVSGALIMPHIEISFYVDSIGNSNEYPSGSFFNVNSSGAFQSARQSSYLYDLISITSAGRSDDNTKVFVNRFVNKTGAAVKVGIIVKLSYILNDVLL